MPRRPIRCTEPVAMSAVVVAAAAAREGSAVATSAAAAEVASAAMETPSVGGPTAGVVSGDLHCL